MSKDLLEEQVEEKEKDLTHCGICLGPIHDPKDLPCLHSFCMNCLKEWAKDDTQNIHCPVCKEQFALPKEGVAGFRSNFFVIKLKETSCERKGFEEDY